jgi:hypothetical protein
MNATRFPLSWPIGWKRTPYHSRKKAAFYTSKQVAIGDGNSYRQKSSLTVGDGLDRIYGELRRLGARNVVISSNLSIREDGRPYANQAKQLEDPGVAVYFRINNADRVLACDRWRSAAENLAAIAGHIAAMRMQDRYGVGTLDQAFAGYAALPPKGSTWRTTLGFTYDQQVTKDEVEQAFRQRSRTAHPDVEGGSHDAMASLTAAKTEALQELQQ